MPRELVTTLLDLIGLVLLAFGAAAGLFPLIGLAGVCVAGVVLLVGSRVAVWTGSPETAPTWWRRLRGGERG
jgi:hypothetical protein